MLNTLCFMWKLAVSDDLRHSERNWRRRSLFHTRRPRRRWWYWWLPVILAGALLLGQEEALAWFSSLLDTLN